LNQWSSSFFNALFAGKYCNVWCDEGKITDANGFIDRRATAPVWNRKAAKTTNMNDPNRRPLKTRNAKWAGALAGTLTRLGITPNSISVFSCVFAAIAGASLWYVGRLQADWQIRCFLVMAACGVQLRLLCNMIDGMVAIEGGCRTKSGEMFNELPDRISDALIFIGAAYAVPGFSWNLELGWSVAVLAVVTAYIRALGVTMGAGQQFLGPMAKPHRMFTLTVTCLLGAIIPLYVSKLIPLALAAIALGCVITCYRRCRQILVAIQAK
jgi:phosphatidylglycerophosphate synthase